MTHALHLSTWHPFIDGVSGAFVLEQCRALQTSGAKVGLLFARVEGLRSLRFPRVMRGLPGFVRLDDPVPTLGFKTWNLPGTAQLTSSFNARMLRNRYAAYERSFGRPDILHAHVALGAGSATRQIASLIGRDYVVTEHSTEILNGGLDSAKLATARAVYGDARCVISVSPVLAERIRAICPTAKIKVIGNLVGDSVFKLRRSRPCRTQRFGIVTIGGLVPHKRTQNVIDTLSRLPGSLRDRIDYDIIGDGPERRMLESLARASGVHTEFHGNLPHLEAMSILSRADLLVHASAYETFGVILAEAMALGVPVVATLSGGPDGIVTEDTGRLVPVDDIDEMRRAIEEVLQSIDEWRARGDSIVSRAYRLYHEANVAKAILEVYA